MTIPMKPMTIPIELTDAELEAVSGGAVSRIVFNVTISPDGTISASGSSSGGVLTFSASTAPGMQAASMSSSSSSNVFQTQTG